ncbi:uncharacterized protein LOC105420053 isoform X2 [Amborella trichopoda]|uniref:uncharacterized protein LOC105420053 isoform X2 n=1 Tax=Amborella trichopoda TaxID=13333 RepID=UPI0005D43C4B|nr:uncharacterized protein LOC105420053 isoform X2 [Amborella trichopoda]|eukprot:XP_011620492.1 uncharacterized protein LOC105420053 isoform X2 [Amborella trichopoda]
MELLLPPSPSPVTAIRNSTSKVQVASDMKFGAPSSKRHIAVKVRKKYIFSALPQNAVPVVIAAAAAVGAAATLLAQTTKASQPNEPSKECEACNGSGICAECNGEGFLLKKLSEESADKARLSAKNMATRYTAGLPKKWSYCSKCSSARSCSICGGRGRIDL